MKRRRFSFLALLVLAVILLMPVTIQAASAPGTVKLKAFQLQLTTKSMYMIPGDAWKDSVNWR